MTIFGAKQAINAIRATCVVLLVQMSGLYSHLVRGYSVQKMPHTYTTPPTISHILYNSLAWQIACWTVTTNNIDYINEYDSVKARTYPLEHHRLRTTSICHAMHQKGKVDQFVAHLCHCSLCDCNFLFHSIKKLWTKGEIKQFKIIKQRSNAI